MWRELVETPFVLIESWRMAMIGCMGEQESKAVANRRAEHVSIAQWPKRLATSKQRPREGLDP